MLNDFLLYKRYNDHIRIHYSLEKYKCFLYLDNNVANYIYIGKYLVKLKVIY